MKTFLLFPTFQLVMTFTSYSRPTLIWDRYTDKRHMTKATLPHWMALQEAFRQPFLTTLYHLNYFAKHLISVHICHIIFSASSLHAHISKKFMTLLFYLICRLSNSKNIKSPDAPPNQHIIKTWGDFLLSDSSAFLI